MKEYCFRLKNRNICVYCDSEKDLEKIRNDYINLLNSFYKSYSVIKVLFKLAYSEKRDTDYISQMRNANTISEILKEGIHTARKLPLSRLLETIYRNRETYSEWKELYFIFDDRELRILERLTSLGKGLETIIDKDKDCVNIKGYNIKICKR